MADNVFKCETKVETMKATFEWSIDCYSMNSLSTGSIKTLQSARYSVGEKTTTASIMRLELSKFNYAGNRTLYADLRLHFDSLNEHPEFPCNFSSPLVCRIEIFNEHGTSTPPVSLFELPPKEYAGPSILSHSRRFLEIALIPWDKLSSEKLNSLNGQLLIRVYLDIFLGPPITTTSHDSGTGSGHNGGGEKLTKIIETEVSTVADTFSKLLIDSSHADLKIECEGQTLSAHKAILAARSTVFARMFGTPMTESLGGLLTIDDFDVDTFKLALAFIYTGKVVKIDDLPRESMLRLLDCAEKYDLTGLKNLCCVKLFQNVTDENAGQAAIAVHLYAPDTEFKRTVLDYCQRRHTILIQRSEYKKFFLKNPEAFL